MLHFDSNQSDTIIRIAKDAITYVDSVIKQTPNYQDENYKRERDYYKKINKSEDQTITLIRNNSSDLNAEYQIIEPNRYIASFDAVVDTCEKYSIGYCSECSYVVLKSLYESALSQNILNLNAELIDVKTPGTKRYREGHCFIVINRKKDSDIHDPSTWGENAVVCDAWERGDNRVYLAKEHSKRFPGEELTQGKFPKLMLPGDFAILNEYSTDEGLDLTLDYIIKNRNPERLMQTFKEQLKLNKSYLKTYESKLDDICNPLFAPSILKEKLKPLKARISYFYNLIDYFEKENIEERISHFLNQKRNEGKDKYSAIRTVLLDNFKVIQHERSSIAQESSTFLNDINNIKDDLNKNTAYTFYKKISSSSIDDLEKVINDFIEDISPHTMAFQEFDLKTNYPKTL